MELGLWSVCWEDRGQCVTEKPPALPGPAPHLDKVVSTHLPRAPVLAGPVPLTRGSPWHRAIAPNLGAQGDSQGAQSPGQAWSPPV